MSIKFVSLVVLGCLLLWDAQVVLAATGKGTTTPPPTNVAPYRVLQGIIRDMSSAYMRNCTPNGSSGTANGGYGFYPTDFELPLDYYQNNEKGLVGKQCDSTNGFKNCGQLGADGTPVYAYTGTSPGKNIQSPTTFSHWFHNTYQVKFLNLSIQLSLVSGSNTYNYKNLSFFPLDGKGWNDHCNGHNYNYCYEVHTLFGYSGGEIFDFTGDDDVWVYINGQLVIDLGALHQQMSATLNVDDIPGLVPGNNYPFDFFYCERHTTQSDIEITTSLAPFCAYYDWCGVCQGLGQGCCTADLIAQYCDDKDPCTTDLCGIKASPQSGSPDGCQHIHNNCTAPDDCHTASCTATGACVITAITCPADKCTNATCLPKGGCVNTTLTCNDNDLCTTDKCDAKTGCHWTNITCPSDACTTGTCNSKIGCQNTTVACNANDKCKQKSCDIKAGCSTQNISCGAPDNCINYNCDPIAGCGKTNVSCDDKMACTVDQCVPGTGAGTGCKWTPLDCSSTDPCIITGCDNATGCTKTNKVCPPMPCKTVKCDSNVVGGCVYTNISCNDGKACTDDICDPTTGQCSNPDKQCAGGDACYTVTCTEPDGACVGTNVTCIPPNDCVLAVCIADAGGCSYPPKTCDPHAAECGSDTCEDGNMCTDNVCNSTFQCEKTNVVCLSPDPSNLCLIPGCNQTTGCNYENKSQTCDDGNPCTVDGCDSTTGKCIVLSVIPQCLPCGNIQCLTTDSCNPQVCDNVTSTCKTQPFTGCPESDHCTNYECDGTGVDPVCAPKIVDCPFTDLCFPQSCVIGTGCVVTNKSCDDGFACTVDSCVSPSGECSNPKLECTQTDLCNPVSCNDTTGLCNVYTPKVCDDGNMCTNDTCDPTTGLCGTPLFVCPSDACAPQVCNQTTGQCDALPTVPCPDSTPCVNFTWECIDGVPTCTKSVNECDDHDPCTTDSCNSTALPGEDVCVHQNTTCNTDACHVNLGCSNVTGLCVSEPLECNTTDYCNPGSCDPNYGCVQTPRICPSKDVNCYVPQCVYASENNTVNGSCIQVKVSNFDHTTGKGGVLCPILYEKGAKAGIITGGVLAGVIIGGVAAAALVGFGGKAGYNYLMAKNSGIGGVANNPLYAPSGASGENALFRG